LLIIGRCLILSSDNLWIVHSCKHYKFSRTEIELLLLLMISEIGVYAKLIDLEDTVLAGFPCQVERIDTPKIEIMQ
jgi:hypothetical protein